MQIDLYLRFKPPAQCIGKSAAYDRPDSWPDLESRWAKERGIKLKAYQRSYIINSEEPSPFCGFGYIADDTSA